MDEVTTIALPPRVGVVVVAYNSRRHLARQAAALEAQTDARWRLILIDNGSTRAERPHVSELPANATLIQSEVNLGFAAANNRAVLDLDTPYVAFLNPDAFPEPGWIAALIEATTRYPDVAAFGSTQLWDHDTALLDGAGDEMQLFGLPYRALYHKPAAGAPGEGETFSACAAAALYRTQAFRDLGGFDERLFAYCEDVDLGYRLRLRGGRTMQLSDAIVRHIGGGRSDFADFHGARNRLWVFVKNTPPLLFWLTTPFHFAATFAILLAHALRGRWASWRGFGAGIAGLGGTLRARDDAQRARTASSGVIARAMIWSPWRMMARGTKR
ncbi:MAG: glycosyltransferase family 2 protein [Pseudomonadota bacterium]